MIEEIKEIIRKAAFGVNGFTGDFDVWLDHKRGSVVTNIAFRMSE